MKVLPWSSCRILLEGEPPEQDGIPLGIVGRLYLANAAPEALKHAFNAFQIRYACEGKWTDGAATMLPV